MEEALKKHGELQLPKGSYIDEFYEKIENEKKNIVSRA